MAARNLLHITKVEAFVIWLIEQGHECRDPVGHYQLLQVRLNGSPIWHAIYRREHMPEHVTVVQPLVPVVHQWLRAQHNAQRAMPQPQGPL